MRESREKVIMKDIRPKGLCPLLRNFYLQQGRGIGMGRFHTTFLGYRIYRKKFLGTAAVVLLLSIAVFSGMLIFLSIHG